MITLRTTVFIAGAVIALTTMLVLLTISCSSTSDEEQTEAVTAGRLDPSHVEVTMSAEAPFRFSPDSITVGVGSTVRWTAAGSAPHTITSEGCVASGYGECSFDSGIEPEKHLRAGTPVDSFSYTFIQPGIYSYICRLHGQPGGIGQSATIIVADTKDQPPAEARRAPVPVPAIVRILSPKDGDVIAGSNVSVQMEVVGSTVRPSISGTVDPRFGHFHLLLDTTRSLAEEFPPRAEGLFHAANTNFTLENVQPGEHTLTLVWGFDNHNPPQPPITHTVRFTTVATP